MINDNMKIAHIGQGKDTLSEVPAPPKYLSNDAKKHYKLMGQYLCSIDRLKTIYLSALEIYANAKAEYEYACQEIQRKNKLKMGTGYIQVFKSGAANITAEVAFRNTAEKTLFTCFKQFGLDPKSDRDLKVPTGDPAQGDLFEQYLNAK